MPTLKRALSLWFLLFFVAFAHAADPSRFSVCVWNVRNFGVATFHSKGQAREEMKSEEEITSMVAIIKRLNPDILGLNEIIQDPHDKFVQLVKDRLTQAGLNYPYSSTTRGMDTRIQNVLLSRFPIREDNPLNQDTFTVTRRGENNGENYPDQMRMERGIINCLLEVTPQYKVRVMLVHLKSPLPVFGLVGDKPHEHGDEIIRRNEAVILKNAMNRVLDADPKARLIVMGDFNDVYRSKALHTLLESSDAAKKIYHLNQTDYLGDFWTHFYDHDREYRQIDYMLTSPTLYHDFVAADSYLYREKPGDSAQLNPMTASDHRPVYAVFTIAP